MQTLSEIRQMLSQAHLRPSRRLGQCFLIDQNLMRKLLELAGPLAGQTVLEVGPGTGSLTEELVARAGSVVAVEIDRGLHGLLARRFAGQGRLVLMCRDVLAGKHRIAPEVLAALGDRAQLVSNLPYNIATPLIAQCLVSSWRAQRGQAGECLFERMTFTVQREVADRLSACEGSAAYGPVSVLVSLLGRLRGGPAAPASAFWPVPKVASRMLRIDFDGPAAARIHDVDALCGVLTLLFGKRRKQIGTIARTLEDERFPRGSFEDALRQAEIDPTWRAERVGPGQFLALSNALAGR